MVKKPIFWIILTLLSLSGVYYFASNYDKAFPALSIDIKMNREMALKAADDLSKKHNWLPQDHRSAISFNSDRNLQTFVELEGGGLDTFKSLYLDSLYFPYLWKVRHFKEQDPNELEVWFTPAGKAYSFRQRLGEDEPGAAISRDSAYAIAMSGLVGEWSIDLVKYELIDESQKIQPGGRVDHRFTFQRSNFSLGENGFLRLNLTVQGDVLGELNHYAHVPEAFNRRFSEMRSANDTIAFSASMVVYVLYALVGCLVGIFLLLRERRILWKKALLWGSIVGLFQALVQLNFMPMMWMNYNTAITTNSFFIEIIIGTVVQFLGMSALYTLSFIAAESLTRKAFPGQLQFWSLWSKGPGSSINVLGQTIGGYLATGLFMFYAIAFYSFVTKTLGWWSPADTAYDPNILAAYFPWLTSIGISLGAGFWEECLFRAVPLAGAALIGDKFGKRNLFIGVMMVVQAFVFGAAHANYPVQPAYARVIELIIPSLVFGFIYLRFGLLVGIIMHYSYDVAMISLPLFIADVPGIMVHRIIIILFLLIPLWVVLFYRQRSGSWSTSPGEIFNRDWVVPPKLKDDGDGLNIISDESQGGSVFSKKETLLGLAIAGSLAWVLFSSFEIDHPSMEISRDDAIVLADKAMAEYGFDSNRPWTVESQHQAWNNKQYQFIWQERGRESYHELLGDYLSEPKWEVRYRLYEGDVVERAEEFVTWVNQEGDIIRVLHRLPEEMDGLSLTEDEARSIVLDFILKSYQLSPGSMVEQEARSDKKPNRLDWVFTYKDIRDIPTDEGELRIKVLLAGDQVSDAYRYVHIPEEWSRKEQDKNAKMGPISFILFLTVILAVVFITTKGVIRWSKKEFNLPLFYKALGFFVFIGILNQWNRLPSILWVFKTSEPYTDQLYQAILMESLIVLFMCLVRSILIGATQNMIYHIMPVRSKARIEKGIYIGLFMAGLFTSISTMFPSLSPQLGSFWKLNDQLPLIGSLISVIYDYVRLTLIVLTVSLSLSYLSDNWSKKVPLTMLYLVLLGIAQASANDGARDSLLFLLLSGFLIAVVFYALHKEIIRFYPSLIPIITGTLTIIWQLGNPSVINGIYSGILLSAIVSSISVAGLGYLWFKELEKNSQ
ncbi:MAG: CPBP family intramembrane metalloprotease [Candidatus Marinimicrobia bacterium]|nr:CPBP family intramembrane metalloprotease [Candidatus Neomarinimicrobiota bacterium]